MWEEKKSYIAGYNDGKKETINKILKFIEKESEFIVDIHADKLLDRLVEKIKKI